MNKTLFAFTLCLTLLAPRLIADEKPEDAPKPPSKFLLKTGGVIVEPIDGKPGIKLLNAQAKVPAELLAGLSPEMQKLYRIPVRTDKAEAAGSAIRLAAKAAADSEVLALVLLCEDPDLPALMVAPEGKWAIVNVTALASDQPAAELLQQRVSKEIWRAATHVLGASNSEFPVCLMKPVFSLSDLDALKAEMICFEPLAGVRQQLAALKVEMLRQTSYRKAVLEGWAPPPANEIQQGVWNELKKEAAD